MGINKVNYGNTTLIDTSNVTVTADKLAQGYTALDNTGTLITGTATSGGYITQDANGYIVVSPTADLPVLKTKSITQNGTYNASSDNADGYSSVTVNVQASGGTMNISTNCVVDTNTYTTLTVSNVQSAPSKFVLVYDNFGSNTSMDLYDYCVSSISYDGTTTNAFYVQHGSNWSSIWKVQSGVITWTYSGTQHTLTFSSSDTFHEFIESTASSGYTLYYS